MYLTQALKRAVQIRANEIATQDHDRIRTWSESLERIKKLAEERNIDAHKLSRDLDMKFSGGGGRIRTFEARGGRFTVCWV